MHKVEICGVNTSKLPLLSEEEKEVLIKKIKNGDQAAREKYIMGNLRLVLSIISRFQNTTESPDDLFQVGCIGLIKAIDNFDSTLNVKFSTYAVPMIIGEIRRFLRDYTTIRVSRSLRDIAYKALYTKEMLKKDNNTEPSLNEISEKCGISTSDILNALDALQAPVSLYDNVYNDENNHLLMDQICDKKHTEENLIDHISIMDAVKKLTPRENMIIALRFNQGKTQMEVAKEIGISQAQVSRLEKSALSCIKQYLES